MTTKNQEHFYFAKHDTVALANKYGTPLYVLSEDILRQNIRVLQEAFRDVHFPIKISYASKAFTCLAMCKIIDDEGLFLDTVSSGEFYTALVAGIKGEKITYHGSNKSSEELTYALSNRAGCVVIDSEQEIPTLQQIAASLHITQPVMIRINPGIMANTHERILTGKADSKFGIPFAEACGAAQKIVAEAPNLRLIGLHCHIGSQIHDHEAYVAAASNLIALYKDISARLPVCLQEINLGGGFNIDYLEQETLFDIKGYAKALNQLFLKHFSDGNVAMPTVGIEPGRYIVGPAGITLYRVGVIKKLSGLRKYVNVDGGLYENPRPAMYNAEYRLVVANKYNQPKDDLVTVSGRCCESDTLFENVMLQQSEPGDILAVLHTGAYQQSMASNYNRLPRPAVVLLKGSESEIIIRREEKEDMISKDSVPSWLHAETKGEKDV